MHNRGHKYHGAPKVPTRSYIGYSFWTRADISFLRAQYPRPDVSAAEVAAELGRTRNAVILKAGRLGIGKEWEMKQDE